ncbi:MAG: arginase family protein [Phycisphaerales bacterium]
MEHLTRTFDWSGIDGSRFASLLSTERRDDQRVVLIGLPDDLGVKLNNGRPGAKDGPSVFRSTLAKMGTAWDASHEHEIGVRIFDAGDVSPANGDGPDALDETHRRVTEVARAFHDEGMIVVGIGGGHDLTFPMVRAYSQSAGRKVGGVNVDPHLDVRERAGSGMPYRRLIEGGFVDGHRFVEFGAGRFDNSREHLDWVKSQGGAVRELTAIRAGKHAPADALTHACEHGGPGFVSIDLDCVEGALGVSAVPALGMPLDTVLRFATLAGVHSSVRHFDIMELSPMHDAGNRTARIAALTFQTFIAGVQERVQS